MAKPSSGSSGKGGQGGDSGDSGDSGGGGKARNLAPVIDDNQTLYFKEDGTSTQNQYVLASDPEGGVLTYSLVDDFNGLFSIDSSTGQITVNDPDRLDYDQGSTYYDLSITVQDDAKKPGITTNTVRVELTDINDNAPEFDPDQVTSFTIAENLSDVVIATVAATDQDASAEHNTLTYTLSGAYADHFEIDQNGTIKLIQALDYEAVSSLELTVTASDGQLSTQQIITLTVEDVLDTNFNPLLVSGAGNLIGSEESWPGNFTQFSPYTIAVTDTDNLGGSFAFDLSVTNIPGSVQLNSYIHGDVYSAEGASFNISFHEEGAWDTFNLEGAIAYQGVDSEGNSLFDISINSVSGFDANATTLYDGNGLNTDPWYSHDTGSFSESYWNPVNFGLNLNWTVSQYVDGNFVESAELLSTLNILDTDSDLEDLLFYADDTMIGWSKPDVTSDPIHVINGQVLTLEFFDPDASVLILEDILDIQPELDIVGEAPLVELGNNQYEVVAEAGAYSLMVNMSHEGLMETFEVQLVVDA